MKDYIYLDGEKREIKFNERAAFIYLVSMLNSKEPVFILRQNAPLPDLVAKLVELKVDREKKQK